MKSARNQRGETILEWICTLALVIFLLWLTYKFLGPWIFIFLKSACIEVSFWMTSPAIHFAIGMAVALWIIFGALAALRKLIVGAYDQLHQFYARFDEISQQHETTEAKIREIAMALRDRSRPVVSSLILFSQGWMVAADKTLPEDKGTVVAVSLLLLVMFGVANECLVRRGRAIRSVGYLLWIGTVALLPIASFKLDVRGATLNSDIFAKAPPEMFWITLGAMGVLLILPFALDWDGRKEDQSDP